MKKGKIIIMSGPSGSGKTTLYRQLLESSQFKGHLVKSISITTRPKRAGEINGKDYYFISKKMFIYKKQAGHFLESQKVFDNYYATPKKQLEELRKNGKNVLLCIDVKGAGVVSKKIPSAKKIFITVPSLAILKKRLSNRGSESSKSIRLRLKTAQKELQQAKYYDFVVVNDQLPKAQAELEKIIINILKL